MYGLVLVARFIHLLPFISAFLHSSFSTFYAYLMFSFFTGTSGLFLFLGTLVVRQFYVSMRSEKGLSGDLFYECTILYSKNILFRDGTNSI